MTLREFRREDAPRLFELLKSEFPEEEAMLGMRPEGFAEVVRRLYRLDMRLLLGFLRAVGRPVFRMFVMEEGGKIAGVTLLTFAPRAGYLSTVVVAPEFRRRGFARQLIETARAASVRRGKPFVTLSVLASNTPARTLYESAGYRTLNRQWFMVHDSPGTFRGVQAPTTIRPFRKADARRLAEIANATLTPTGRNVTPVRAQALSGTNWTDKIFSAETAAWVVDRGAGPEAHVSASTSPTTEAAHLSSPIVGEGITPTIATELVRVAGAWLSERKPLRIATTVAEENRRGRVALEEAGYHAAIELFNLYRPSG